MLASTGSPAGLRPVRLPSTAVAGCIATGRGRDAQGMVRLASSVDGGRGPDRLTHLVQSSLQALWSCIDMT